MASLANLVVTLAADTAAFTTGFDKASREGKRSMYKMEKDIEASARRLGVAFAAAATAMAVIVKKTVDVADQMRDLSMQTGISTEVLSGYAYAAEQSGTSLEQLTGGIRKMQKSIVDASSGMAEQVKAFDRLGLSAEQLLQMSPDKAFELIAEKLSKMENASLRAATAQEIFGRAGTKLLPLMAEGAAGIQEMVGSVERFNAVVSQDFANNADRFNDNIGDMKLLAKGAAITFTEALLPSLIGVQEYLIKAATGSNDFSGAAETLIEWVKRLIGGFILLKGILQSVGVVIVAVADTLIQSFTAMIAPITGLVDGLAHALNALKQGDLQAAADALADIPSKIGERFVEGFTDAKRAMGFIGEGIAEIQDATDQSLAELEKAFTPVETAVEDLGGAALDTAGDFGKLNKQLDDARKKYADKKIWTAIDAGIKAVNKTVKEANDLLDELIAEQERYEQSIDSLIDRLFPLESATRKYNEELSFLRREAQEAGWSTDRLADAERRLAKEFNDTRKQITGATDDLDLLSVAMEEGARIMERAFQGMWENLLSGADNTFDSILDGFKSLISQMIHEATTRKITLQIQQAFGEDGGGFSDLDFGGAFGQDLVSAIGAIAGQAVAGTDIGSFLSSLGAIGGKWLGEQLGWWLGAWGGPIGLAIGSVAGAIIGDWISGVFERDLRFSLGGENQRTLADNQTITTALGTILSPSAQGGFGSLNDPNSFGGQIAAALTQFDTGLADILGQFATDDQFTAVTDALEDWVGTWGETATVADVLSSRFNVILGQFSTDIQDFVRGAESFEEQIERFGVALATDKLIRENPEIFSGRAAGEILNLVAAMQSGSETMGEAFDQFLILLNRVVNVRNSLQSFAQSDLLSDYSALSGETSLADALAAVNQGIIDAITNFDGSIESLEEIGALAMIAREGELKLLAQIDAIQKGINANLDKLQADILGLSEPDKTGEQLFMDAQSLIGKIKPGMSAEEIADLERQFSGIISAIAPEDQLRMQSEILAIIELFRNAANAALNTQRNDVLGNAETVRDVVDVFLTEIGDPLSIIAGALEGRNIPEVMEDGLSEINTTVATIGPQVAQALQSGLAGVQFNVTLQSPGLVTQ